MCSMFDWGKCKDSLLLLPPITSHNISAARSRIRRGLQRRDRIDESYFGGMRKGKRGRGACGKVPVFGLLKRGGRIPRSFQMHLEAH